MIPIAPNVRFILVALLVAGNVVFYSMWRATNAEYQSFKASVEFEREKAEAEAKRRESEHQRINAEVAAGWSAAVDWYRNHPRIVRVREPAQVPPISTPTTTTNAAAIEQRPDTREIASTECEERLNNAVLDAAQVMWLQDWIRQQHEVGK